MTDGGFFSPNQKHGLRSATPTPGARLDRLLNGFSVGTAWRASRSRQRHGLDGCTPCLRLNYTYVEAGQQCNDRG